MPARDGCEPQMIRAFENDGWTLTNQPYPIQPQNMPRMYADLRIERADEVALIVEVKCFPESTTILDQYYRTIGQYLVYRHRLSLMQVAYPLLLAIPEAIAVTFFALAENQSFLGIMQIDYVAINLEQEKITRWTLWPKS